ncbi:hypothetical protein CC80DRAFT_490333 [Byssothecium circinans]|uniref:Uncharacterized protein n=1 Tax=Byssothecium circinans TaxID=147558 RepID=A0A6A5U3F8_9PLEO|nr:hypothetical protein CC80DRAFT_490333 [Byssothecium circinans]
MPTRKQISHLKKRSKEGAANEKFHSILEEKLQKITARNQQLSPLLRLPAELRNKIYSLVLGGCNIPDDLPLTRPHFLALLATCRQTNTETRTLPFTLNTVLLHEGNDLGKLVRYPNRISQNMTTLELRWQLESFSRSDGFTRSEYPP